MPCTNEPACSLIQPQCLHSHLICRRCCRCEDCGVELARTDLSLCRGCISRSMSRNGVSSGLARRQKRSDRDASIAYLREQGLSYRQIAKELGCSLANVVDSVNRGRR